MICEGNGLSRPEALAALGVLGATLACTSMSHAMPTTPGCPERRLENHRPRLVPRTP